MIHTMTIGKDIYPDDNIISYILNKMNKPPQFQSRYFSTDEACEHLYRKCTYYPNSLYFGINAIQLIRYGIETIDMATDEKNYTVAFQLRFVVNPYRLIHQNEPPSVNLFIPTANNISILNEQFDRFIKCFLPALYDEFTFDKMLAKRIDYSFNFKIREPDKRSAFYKVIHKTSMYNRTKLCKSDTQKRYEQSAAEKNKSRKIIIYDKAAEIANMNYINTNQKRTLEASAREIIRFEIQFSKQGIKNLVQKYALKSSNVLNFLDKDIAYNELISGYKNTIGIEDFYDRSNIKSILRKSCTDSMSEKLINITKMIAQTRSIAVAKEKYVTGYALKNSNIKLKGTTQTFNNHIKKLRQLGINPVPLTDGDKVCHVKNPIHQLEEMYKNLI